MSDERTVIVTGGAGGLGTATVSAFLAGGWRVVAPVRPGRHAAVPAGAIVVEGDLSDAADVTAAVAIAAGDAGAPLRAVVNVAGAYAGGGLIADTPIEDFEHMLTVNLRPTYLVTAAALPHLVAAGGGGIVCVSSRAAVAPFAGAAGYVTAKAAVLAFAGAVAVEYKKAGVRCNTVLPSVIDTPANRRSMPDADFSRWVRPAEITPTILFLASDASAPTTGAQIPVYGQS
ncbi:NAD(P)-dependent dehydrogenase (short-subunit alcohol dehydrogenase family) [Actinoplanes tereljensis]|uniref:Glucose 1-dehydrogenase n=1 Tax=Paractinoplanes tereljensis TaxID=571912 RepID=A0A919TR14_9ACTN|nr:SDR family NAD(P)-dependent oxidoreductase [Actinoplanes tereljensis]GIF18921.1 glucose 1-dehydrogenase [Actinoplanes tereljensis]